MNWRVEFAPEVETDVSMASDWYEYRQPDLGAEFVEEIIRVWDVLSKNPLLNCRRHPTNNIRWRYPDYFPYRLIHKVRDAERTVKVATVLHAARHDRHWLRRI